MAQVYVSVGSNIDRERKIAAALQALAEHYGVLQQSSVFESAAVGFNSEPFYNLVLGFKTEESPQAVQDRLHAIEDRGGRQRSAALSPRTLDLDLLLYDDLVLTDGNLVLPREDINRYAFVLGPLAEIAGEERHPKTGISYADMWAAFDDDSQILTRIDWPPAAKLPGNPVADASAPVPQALELSARLSAVIRNEIDAADGTIPFSRYMELCLYSPGLGYYSAGLQKFGAGGDFVTAPELSPLFGRCLAHTCSEVLESLQGGDILEFGAGSGRLAVDILGELERLACLPRRYLILERSAELRQRQQQLLQRELPQLLDRVAWIDTLPDSSFCGVMLANEVLDAMAVERFRWDGKAASVFNVSCGNDAFQWCLQQDCGEVGAAVALLVSQYTLGPGYISELNVVLPAWLKSVAGSLEQGVLLLIDYGYPRHEYYHPQRSSGTLMCHYRQRAHDDPFLWPGLQDITAHVDFTAVAEAALAAGLEVSGYTTQASFLLDCGLDGLLQQAGPSDSIAYMQLAQQAKTLILPGEMGERFKCIGLTRGMTTTVPGFRMRDYRGRL